MSSYEESIMSLILNAGNARSLAIEAFRLARAGRYEEADQHLAECQEALNEAHEAQTGLIQAELSGEKSEVTLLMVHAQDHVMNAMTVHDLVREMIEMIRGNQQ